MDDEAHVDDDASGPAQAGATGGAPGEDEPIWSDERIAGIVGWTIIQAYLAFLPRLAAAVEPAGISPTQFGVLVQVDNRPGISQGELARRCWMTPQSMGQLLPALEERGLLRRGERRGRGHPIPVRLTDQGRAALRRVTPAVVRANSAAAMHLDDDEHAQLNALLRRTLGGPGDPLASGQGQVERT